MTLDPISLARKGVLAYIGAVALTGDQVKHTFDRLAERGEKARRAFQTRFGQGAEAAGVDVPHGQAQFKQVRSAFLRTSEHLLDVLNIPTATSIQELNDQVAVLNAEIDYLRVATKRRAERPVDEPLPDYHKLNADAVIARLPELTEPALLALRAYEQTHANRVTVLRAVERTQIERQVANGTIDQPAVRTTVEPLPRYGELRVEEIVERLADLDPATLRHVQVYEQEHAGRVTVLRAVEERLAVPAV